MITNTTTLRDTRYDINVYTDGIADRINMLQEYYERGELKCKDVLSAARSLGLTLAGQGAHAPHSKADGFVYWNETGNSDEPAIIMAEYSLDPPENDERVPVPGTITYLFIDRRRTGFYIAKSLASGEPLSAFEFVQACKIHGIRVSDELMRSINSRIYSFKTLGDHECSFLLNKKYENRPLSHKVWALAAELMDKVAQQSSTEAQKAQACSQGFPCLLH